jgi:hypothetical protein
VQRALDQSAAHAEEQATDAETYVTDDASNWAGSPPATQDAAINRMAALLKALNAGTPIP